MSSVNEVNSLFSNVILANNYTALDAGRDACSVQLRLVDTEGQFLEHIPITESVVGNLPSLMHAITFIKNCPDITHPLNQHYNLKVPQDVTRIDIRVHNGKDYLTTSYFLFGENTDYSDVDVWKDKLMLLLPDRAREIMGWLVPQILFVMDWLPGSHTST